MTIDLTRKTYLRFRAGWKAQNLDRALLPFKSSLQPYAAWYGLVTITMILILSGFSVFLRGNWDTADFVTNYIPLMFAPILFAVASYVMKSEFVRVGDMDFDTGLDEVIADTYDEPPPKNIWEKFWLWIVSTPPHSFLPGLIVLLACSSRWLQGRCLIANYISNFTFHPQRRNTRDECCNAGLI